MNAGLRVGGYDGGWQSGHGDSSVYDTTYVDPRIGMVWDIKGDSRSAVKVHWGRYHDKMYTYLYDREASGEAVIPDLDCYWDDETGGYTDCDEPTVIAARMGSDDHAYVDETLLSFEQQIGTDMLIGFDFLDRRFSNIMAMVNVNEDYELLTGSNPLTGGDLPIWNLLSPTDFVLTTDNGAYRDFQSATLRFDKRYSRGWSGRGLGGVDRSRGQHPQEQRLRQRVARPQRPLQQRRHDGPLLQRVGVQALGRGRPAGRLPVQRPVHLPFGLVLDALRPRLGPGLQLEHRARHQPAPARLQPARRPQPGRPAAGLAARSSATRCA